jgi:hypothetical protein
LNSDPRSGAAFACANDPWPPAKIEREAGTLHGYNGRLAARIHHAYHRGPGSVEPHVRRRRGERDRSEHEPEGRHRPIAVNVTVAV